MTPREYTHMYYDNVMDVVASTVRAGITAPDGYKLVVCDLASIESRVLGWLTGCGRMNRVFAEDRDTYKDFAASFFQVPYEEVTKQQRTFAKPPVLGCGYQLGADGLIKYAAPYGVDLTYERAREAVNTFRGIYPEVPQFWYTISDVCAEVVQQPEERAWTGRGLTVHGDGRFLKITLPSARTLYYYQPTVEPREIYYTDRRTGEEKSFTKMSVTYMGLDQLTHQWVRLTTHGGKLTENIVQAIARDILADALRVAEREDTFSVIGHVHDEIICLAEDSKAEAALDRLTTIMAWSPGWAPELKLGAAGYIAKRYRKE